MNPQHRPPLQKRVDDWDVLAFMVVTYAGLVTMHAIANFGVAEWPGALRVESEVFVIALFVYWAPTLAWTAEFLIVRWLVRMHFPIVPTRSRVLAASLAASITPATLLFLDTFVWHLTTAGTVLWFVVLTIPPAATALILPFTYRGARSGA